MNESQQQEMMRAMKARAVTKKSRRARAEPRARLGLDERRTQLLVLGRELFSLRAYDDIQIDDIARAAGISKGLLYHYFGSKRGFYVATVETAAAEMLAATKLDGALPPPEKARRSMEAYLDFVEQHAGAFLALMRGGIGTDPEVSAIVDRTRNELVQRFVSNLGLTEPRPVWKLAARSWVGMVEAASLSYLEQRSLDREGVNREMLLTLLLESLHQIVMTARRLDPGAPLVLVLPPEPEAVKRPAK